MSLLQAIESQPELHVRQRKEWTEILVDWETRNQYALLDAHGQTLGLIAERGRGAFDFLRRGFLRSHRPLDIVVCELDGRPVLRLQRPFFWIFSSLHVSDAAGAAVGDVERRFGVLHRRYDLLDESGRPIASIAGPRWRIWTFPVRAADGASQALIEKKWGGALRELFSDADSYRVRFEHGHWPLAWRLVVLAAAISIDFDFFENNQGNGGLLRAGD